MGGCSTGPIVTMSGVTSPGWSTLAIAASIVLAPLPKSSGSHYLAEVLRALRRTSHVDAAERYYEFGTHVGGRDAKAVRKTVSGLIKLLHPDGNATREEIGEYVELGLEMRRRVKEQLKKMGGLEYWDVNFSYTDRTTDEQRFVPLPESGGGLM